VIWYRRDDLDDLPSGAPPFRSDRLRELVDQLPELERHVVERHFFGGDGLAEAGREVGATPKQAADARDRALARLRELVLEDHSLGPLPAAEDPELDPRPVHRPLGVDGAGPDA
jgi:DNA-directed RNA polymerase specialized sigma24 family protein